MKHIPIFLISCILFSCLNDGQAPVSDDTGTDQVTPRDGLKNSSPVTVSDNSVALSSAAVQDAPSHGATMTIQEVGKAGWYPSRRDPASGQCDVTNTSSCCMTRHDIPGDALTPWDEDLSMTLRGPMIIEKIAAYQPGTGSDWDQVGLWESQNTAGSHGIKFWGNGSESGWDGIVGNVCEVEVAPDRPFGGGSGSVPYCPAGNNKYYGWEGSKLIILLASAPHYGTGIPDDTRCGDPGSGWHDAPWIGLTHGELVRSGRYSGCHCWSREMGSYAQDGCGQFNVFEIVNDGGSYKNLDLFSTNLVSYAGYIGEGPCGVNCDITGLDPAVDMVDKSNDQEVSVPAMVTPGRGSNAAFRRPTDGFRYFVILMDVQTRTIQLALLHPDNLPPGADPLLPGLPDQITRQTVDNLLALRLPEQSTGIIYRR